MECKDTEQDIIFEEVIVHTIPEDEIIEYVGDMEENEIENYEIVFEDRMQNRAPLVVEVIDVVKVESTKRENVTKCKRSAGFNAVEEFMCPYCICWFKAEAVLIDHLKIHVGPKDQWCHFCRKLFAMGYLRKHLKVHFTRRYSLAEDVVVTKKKSRVDATQQALGKLPQRKQPARMSRMSQLAACCSIRKEDSSEEVLACGTTLMLPNSSLWDTPLVLRKN